MLRVYARMSLYFDSKVQSPDPGCININIEWHEQHPLLAVSSYSQERGGFVTIYDELGDPLPDVVWPQHAVAQVTALAWHPTKKLLVTGWENGDLQAWAGDPEFISVQSVHQAPITILQWSTLGGRLVSGDTAGSLVGLKVDSRGHILTVFHHELKDPLTHIAFRRNPKHMSHGLDINGLAKAAVAGDERALDLFSGWRPRTAGQRFSLHPGQGDNLCFYMGAISGTLFYCTEEGTCTEVLNTEGALLKKLLYHEHKDNLIVMTEDLNVGQFQVNPSGQLIELMKVKLSGRSQDASVVWAGPGLLAVITGDLSVRFWDLDTGESYLLDAEPVNPSISDSSAGASNLPTEVFTSLSFCSQKGILSAGTNVGTIVMWRFLVGDTGGDVLQEGRSGFSTSTDPAQNWLRELPCNVRGAVKHVTWSQSHPLLAVNTITSVFVLREQELCAHYGKLVSAVQVSPSQLVVEVESKENRGSCHTLELNTDLQVKGVAVTTDHVALWSSKTFVVYQLITEGLGDDTRITSKTVGSFSCEVESALIHEQSLLILEGEQTAIQVRTFQGTIKQMLTTNDTEGQPIGMQLCGSFLTVATAAGWIKIWNLSRREAKHHSNPKNLEDAVDDFGEIIAATCNSSGTKVSLTIAKSNFLPDPKLFIWDVESDSLRYFNLATGKLDIHDDGDTENYLVDQEQLTPSSALEQISTGTSQEVSGRFVLSHVWDEDEPRLLVCEAKLLPKSGKSKMSVPLPEPSPGTSSSRRASSSTMTMPAASNSDKESKEAEVVLVTFFATPDSEHLLLQDVTPLQSGKHSHLLAVHIPYYLLLRKHSQQQTGKSSSGMVERFIMKDFEGLQNCDKQTRDAVLDFSYNLSVGNMDEAFRAIKTISSEAVWESLARMCVKTKRLDVAFVCLGHMKHARGAMALREAMNEPELDARVAMLAVQLGLTEDAERLYSSCGRWDLLNKMYQSGGEWDRALKIAEEKDRIHLRTTYFKYACHLEAKGDLMGATRMYERADVHHGQVPRMLLDDQQALEQYVLKSKDPQLVKWWGQYMESTGNMDRAVHYYKEAKDHFSLVRVLCFQQNLSQASEIASATGDRAACYHLARQYEAMGKISEAIHFFSRAQAYGTAVRICKEQGMEEQVWNLALLAGPREQLEAAQYFESSDKPEPDKAVLLYHRAGMLHKALDLAFKNQQFSALQFIAVDLNSTSDPALIQKCARFFVENGQYDKAVNLLAVGKQYVEALSLCIEHNIPVTEDLAEKLTMNKGEGDEATRVRVLEKVAESALAQGNYHLATKKFTQAGNKVAAMKALLKSGDTEKIIFFANVSRQREIYIMAANYLQSLDWQNQPEVLKNIVAFYTKGRAPDLLANFYVACAQVEVDEYQSYEKALGALAEAGRCLAKVTTPRDPVQHQRVLDNLNTRTVLVKRFVDIRRVSDRGDRETALAQCRQLLQHSGDLDAAGVRVGDVYALMVDSLMAGGDFQGAQQLVEEFRRTAGPGVNLAYYLSSSTLDRLARELGMNLKTSFGSGDKHMAFPQSSVLATIVMPLSIGS
ncbi:intraflagellar transport protein 140 homolog isoform X3 [Zootermopsis nevadensis]|uniref:intraflagellar transport protein 140 homolog isoform X3 n=1 Tax=Zootermopsis nevadensis TaxID=136037 RepID=UPI000B8E43D7|nr:intraflagellar transport protein 140 homolog isoform X3 [Zootermopsis nevadensis]